MIQDDDDRLPSLESQAPGAKVSWTSRSRSSELLIKIRRIAKSLRLKKSRRFYSVRAMAAHFGVSIGTVTSVYQRLEQEGILARIRGFRTLLVGRELSPRVPVRAVIGIVSRAFSMIVNPDTRALDMDLIEHLSQRGYVADLIFHVADHNEPELVEHLVRHRVDIALIQVATLKIRQNLLALRDHGIRTIALQDKLMPADLPAAIYQQDWFPAYKSLAIRWHAEGVRHALIPMRSHLRSERTSVSLQSIFREQGIEAAFSDYEDVFRSQSVRRGRMAVAFLDRFGAGRVFNRHPLEGEELLKRTRVAFCRGPIYVPYLCHQKVQADVVVYSSVEIARKIAGDLGGIFSQGDGVKHVFTPNLLERVSFADPVTD